MSFSDDRNIINYKWQIDCPKVEIFNIGTGELLDTLCGTVRQTNEGVLCLHAMKSGERDWSKWSMSSTPGMLMGQQYGVKAYSHDSDTPWETESFGFDQSLGRQGYIIKSELQKVIKNETLPSSGSDTTHYEFAELLLKNVNEFPTLKNNEYTSKEAGTTIMRIARDESEFSCSSLKFTSFHDKAKDLLKVYISPIGDKRTIPNDAEKIIVHAVQLVTGKRVEIITSERLSAEFTTKTIHSIENMSQQGVLPPLLNIQVSRQSIEMLKTYTSYMLKKSEAERFNIAYSIQSVINSSGSNLEARCLTIAVEIENLVNNILAEKIIVHNSFTKKEINDIKIHATATIDENRKERISALVDSLNIVRAKDRLNSLVGREIIPRKLVGAWDKLRNKSAHGSLIIRDNEMQKYGDYYDQCLSLFYRLIFLEIEYTGSYTDYSEHGYQLDDFYKTLKVAT